jgi:hypothetical protein
MKKTIIVLLSLILLSLAMMIYLESGDQPQIGSVTVGNEYYATTTAGSATGFAYATTPFLIKKGQGTLGSVIVAKAGTAGGSMNFYNATTTNVSLRTGNVATTSIIFASVPSDLAAGTYTYDAVFTTGLLVDWTGTIGTSTIMYR